MIPLINGQSLFEQKTESLKTDLESMLLDLEGPVNLVAPPQLGLIKRGWCSHSGSSLSWADVDGDGIADMLCDDLQGRHWALLSDGRGGIKKDVGQYRHSWCVGLKTNWADVNGDGKADILCDSEDGRHCCVGSIQNPQKYPSLGGTWSKPHLNFDDNFCKGGNFKWVDMNGDKKADMVCDYPGSGSHLSQYSLGDGNFINMGDIEKRFCTGDNVVNYADINGDGLMDIICSHHDDGEQHVVFLDG